MTTEAALLAAIESLGSAEARSIAEGRCGAPPADVAAHLVYADWLQNRGDPRGELIVLQRELDEALDGGVRMQLELAIGELFARHAGLVPPPLDGVRCMHAAVRWSLGFVRDASLVIDARNTSPHPLRDNIIAFFAHPSVRTSRLDLAVDYHPDPPEALAAFEDALVPQREVLRDFTLSGAMNYDVPNSGPSDVAPLCRGLPRLRRLAIQGLYGRAFPLDYPELEELAIGLSFMTPVVLEHLHSAQLPALRTLAITSFDPWGPMDELHAILASPGMPNLTRLALNDCSSASELLVHIADSPLAPRLTELAVSNCGLRDGDIEVLVDRTRFPALRALDLHGNMLTGAVAATLESFPGSVSGLGLQESPDPPMYEQPRRRWRDWARRILGR